VRGLFKKSFVFQEPWHIWKTTIDLGFSNLHEYGCVICIEVLSLISWQCIAMTLLFKLFLYVMRHYTFITRHYICSCWYAFMHICLNVRYTYGVPSCWCLFYLFAKEVMLTWVRACLPCFGQHGAWLFMHNKHQVLVSLA
jgi:hypothetical protein